MNFCWHCLADEGETPVGSAANPFQQEACRLSNEVVRTYEVLDGLSNGLMMLRSSLASHHSAIPIRLEPIPRPSVAVAADPIPVPIPESPDWFFTKAGKNRSWVTVTAFDGEKETFYFSRKPALLVERLNEGRRADGGWVTNEELRAAIGETRNTLDPMRFFHGTREAGRYRFFKICGDTDGCRRKLVRPASFE